MKKKRGLKSKKHLFINESKTFVSHIYTINILQETILQLYKGLMSIHMCSYQESNAQSNDLCTFDLVVVVFNAVF